MNNQKVLELAQKVWSAAGGAVYIGPSIGLLTEFAALVEREVRVDAEPVAWIITRKTAKNGLRKYAVLGSYSLASAHCDVGSPEPLYSHSVSVNAEIVGTVKELFTNSALERLDLRPSTKVYIAPPTPAPAASAESVASVHIKDGCLIGSQRKSGVDIPDGQYALYPIGTFPAPAVDAEPVAWMSPKKERLEFSRADTVYGSHTIPLYTHPAPAVVRQLVDGLTGIIDFIEIDNLKIDQDAFRIAKAALAAVKENGL